MQYSVVTQKIYSNTYLHYSNDYIEGKVLVDIKIGLEKKPCDDKTKNDNLDISKYKCKDNDLDLGNTYQKLDEFRIDDLSYNYINIININQKIYLYSRSYISTPKEYKIYHKFNKIKNFANKKSDIYLKLYFVSFLINCCCNNKCNFNNINSLSIVLTLFLINIVILMICPIIKICLVSIAINNYRKYNKFIFSNINHGIKNYYKPYPWFIKYDIVILTFDIFVLIPSLIVLTSILIVLCGIFGKKAIDSISEKLKKREERKQRIKKYKEEIKELEKNPDIPISKINKKKLEFFKEKFYDALTCPISLDIFKEPVIVSSGHTYEKEYIMKIINDKSNDPLTRQPLNNEIIVRNYLVNKLIIEFNSGLNFNENIFNKMIELLKCPLSHKIYHEPYLASVGNEGMTYERSYIEDYFYNNKKDPTFNENIKGELIKNFVIKDMVDALIEMNEKRKDYSIEITNELDEKMNNSLIINDKLNKDSEIKSKTNDLIDENKIKNEVNEKNN